MAVGARTHETHGIDDPGKAHKGYLASLNIIVNRRGLGTNAEVRRIERLKNNDEIPRLLNRGRVNQYKLWLSM